MHIFTSSHKNLGRSERQKVPNTCLSCIWLQATHGSAGKKGKKSQLPRAQRAGPTCAPSWPAVELEADTLALRASLTHLEIKGRGCTSNPLAICLSKERDKASACGALVCTKEGFLQEQRCWKRTSQLNSPAPPTASTQVSHLHPF